MGPSYKNSNTVKLKKKERNSNAISEDAQKQM